MLPHPKTKSHPPLRRRIILKPGGLKTDPFSPALTAIMLEVVELIRETRTGDDVSHYAVARRAHVARQTPANLEADAKNPTLGMIVRFFWALDIAPEELARIIRRHQPGGRLKD
jgi:DNA-binding XRE family transcriptional regulator